VNKINNWRDAGIFVLGIIVSVIIIVFMTKSFNKYAIEVGGSYYMEGISNITTSILTVWLIVFNILLVLKTYDYVKLTKKMVDETKKQTRISEMTMTEQYKLKKQKRKILEILVGLPPNHVYPPEELARLTSIDGDLILYPIMAMMEDGLMKIDNFGNYKLRREN